MLLKLSSLTHCAIRKNDRDSESGATGVATLHGWAAWEEERGGGSIGCARRAARQFNGTNALLEGLALGKRRLM